MSRPEPRLQHRVIGVVPPEAHGRRQALFTALGHALDVEFVPRQLGEEQGLDAIIVLGADATGPRSGPLPSLAIVDRAESSASPGPIRLHDEEALDRRLRGIAADERGAASRPGLEPSGAVSVLATTNGRPVWLAALGEPVRYLANVVPDELSRSEVLRDRLRNGRFLALLPIIELARGVLGAGSWQPPPLRACFLFDDPNLHWPSYGHLNFAALAREGSRRGYHVAMATVPLDGWYVHPKARAAFVGNPRVMSLIVHGNEHVRSELARERSAEAATAIALQASARIRALERTHGLTVDRIMAPPHGVCSETMATGLLRAGFEALTASSYHPWLPVPPSDSPLSGWWPGEFVAGGLPVLERWPFDTDLAELAFLAYLDHPLVLYGHHRDVAGGLERLRDICDAVETLGHFTWQSLGEIARSNYSVRRDADAVRIRMHCRVADVRMSGGPGRLLVELPGHSEADRETVISDGASAVSGQAFEAGGGSQQRLMLRSEEQADPGDSTRSRAGPWPMTRRILTEARDRSVTVIDRLAARGSPLSGAPNDRGGPPEL